MNYALANVKAEDRELFQQRLEVDVQQGTAETRNGKRKYDKFVQDYLGEVNRPVVMEENNQQAQAPQQPTLDGVAPEIPQPKTIIQGGQAEIQLGTQGAKTAQYELVEADELAVNLKPNVYQNRDRTGADSQAQIMDYANNLNPNYLGASVDVTQGAPTVDDNYGVFAGNGRLAAIKQAYAKNPQNATAYRNYLAQNARQFGLMAEQVQGMKQPVLVRKVAGDINLKKAVEEGNFNTGLDKGVLGNAKANAGYISDDLLDLMVTNEDGSLNLSGNNTPFISGLVAKIPVEQRPQFFATKKLGNQNAYTLTAQGRELVENALLVKAYSDGSTYADNLLTDLIANTDEGNKRVKAALTAIAGKIIQTKGTDYDISGELVQAYDLMSKGKKAGVNAQEAANQGDMVNPPSEFTREMVGRFYSPKSVAELQQPLNDYLNSVIQSNLHNTQQGGMFADEQPSKEDLLRDVGLLPQAQQVQQQPQAEQQAQNQPQGEVAPEKRGGKKSHLVSKEQAEDLLVRAEQLFDEYAEERVAFSKGNHNALTKETQDKVNAMREEIGNMLERTFSKGTVKEHNEIGKWLKTYMSASGFYERNLKNAENATPEIQQNGQENAPETGKQAETKTSKAQQGVEQSAIQTPYGKERETLERILGKELADEVNLISRDEIANHIELEDGVDVKRIHGFFSPETGKLFVVPENISRSDYLSSGESLSWVAWHELSHKGLGGRFGKQLENVLKNAGKNTLVRKMAEFTKKNINPKYTFEEAVEEALVELSAAMNSGRWEQIENTYGVHVPKSWRGEQGVVDKLLNVVARVVKRIAGAVIGKDLTKADNKAVFDLLKGLQNDIKGLVENRVNGNASSESNRYSKQAKASNESVLKQASERLKRVATDILNGANYISNKPIDLGATPEIFERLGVPQLPIRISEPSKLFQIVREQGERDHGISPDVLAEIPYKLQEPLAVFNSDTEKNALVAVMELKDSKNRPVIAAVHINKKAGFNQINKVASIYGKDFANKKFSEWTDKGLLRYLNNEKSQSLLTSFGLQSPTEKSMKGLLGDNVLLQSDIVNGKTRFSYEIKPRKRLTAEEVANSEKVRNNPTKWERLKEGNFKEVMREFNVTVDTLLHDRLRPVMDWIKGFDIVGVSDYQKEQLMESIYRAEGVRDDYIARAEQQHLDGVKNEIAKIADKYFKGDVETSVAKIGLWVSSRWAIEKNAKYIAEDKQKMDEAEQAYNDAVANNEPDNVLDRLERKWLEAEMQYHNRVAEVNSKDRKGKAKVAGGWSNPQAESNMKAYEKIVPRKVLEAFADKLYDLNEWDLNEGLKTGRYTDSEVNEWLKDRHYVPLTGDPQMEVDDVFRMPGNKTVNAPRNKKAEGRLQSEADGAIKAIFERLGKNSVYDGFIEMKQNFDKIYEQAIDEQFRPFIHQLIGRNSFGMLLNRGFITDDKFRWEQGKVFLWTKQNGYT